MTKKIGITVLKDDITLKTEVPQAWGGRTNTIWKTAPKGTKLGVKVTKYDDGRVYFYYFGMSEGKLWHHAIMRRTGRLYPNTGMLTIMDEKLFTQIATEHKLNF